MEDKFYTIHIVPEVSTAGRVWHTRNFKNIHVAGTPFLETNTVL